MHFTGDISAGSIAIVFSVITMAITVGLRFGALERGLKDLIKAFDHHEREDREHFQQLHAML